MDKNISSKSKSTEIGLKVLTLILVAISMVIITECLVNHFGRDQVFDKPDLIVVLGCGNRVMKPLLNDRLEAAIRAHVTYPSLPILLTGDEKNKYEITSMSKYLKERLPAANILLDPHSLNTWDSFVYVKNNYAAANLLVITNEFHQKRAIFFSKILKLSAKSYGKDLNFSNNWYMFLRERLARLLVYKYLAVGNQKKTRV